MSDEKKSQAKDIMSYSFLVAFANDGTLDTSEVEFMKRLALEDDVIDEKEKRVFRQIFSRISEDKVSVDTWAEITKFRREFDI